MVQETLFNIAEIQISYKSKFNASERPQILSSDQAYQVLIGNWSLDRIEFLEEFKIILLNRRNKVLGMVNISQGGLSGTLADAKIIFAVALKSGASGIILCHNHPSEEFEPGKEDLALTKRLQQCGSLLEIEIVDHLIVCKDNFYSFADEGLL